MRSDLIKEKYSGFPGRMLPFIALGKSKTFFEPTQRNNMGMQCTLLHFWKTIFSCPDEGQRNYGKNYSYVIKTATSPGGTQNSRSGCFDYAFHLKLSCCILNPTKLSTASRITNRNQGPTSNPWGVQRAGSRNVDCVCCYKNPSHATNYKCMEKRRDLLCKSKCKKFLGIPNRLHKVRAPAVCPRRPGRTCWSPPMWVSSTVGGQANALLAIMWTL